MRAEHSVTQSSPDSGRGPNWKQVRNALPKSLNQIQAQVPVFHPCPCNVYITCVISGHHPETQTSKVVGRLRRQQRHRDWHRASGTESTP